MRIFAKKTYEFKNSDGESIKTAPLQFQTVPDWVEDDDMFKWATADGDIEIMAETERQKEIETGKKGGKKADKDQNDSSQNGGGQGNAQGQTGSDNQPKE